MNSSGNTSEFKVGDVVGVWEHRSSLNIGAMFHMASIFSFIHKCYIHGHKAIILFIGILQQYFTFSAVSIECASQAAETHE